MTETPPDNRRLLQLASTVLGGGTDDRRGALELYLFLPAVGPPGPHGYRLKFRSSLEALLGDIRGTLGRDPSGALVDPGTSRTWLGALGYLALVDQLGKLLELPPVSSDTGQITPFERLLLWDGCVTSAEAAALYALRCAFVHNFGLLNEPDRGSVGRRRLLRHVFTLTADRADLLRLGDRRSEKLDGPLEELPPTTVDLISLGDTVEQLVADLRARHLRREGLALRPDIPLSRLLRACFFQHLEPNEWSSGM